jgi:hypothetical protein
MPTYIGILRIDHKSYFIGLNVEFTAMANNKNTFMRPNSEEDWKNGQRHAPAALYPREGPPVYIGQEAGWAPEPVSTRS